MKAVLALGILASLGCGDQAGRDRDASELRARVTALEGKLDMGRYQIVNGMPSMAKSITLLDTKTGRSWLMCAAKDSTSAVATNWCAMKTFGIAPSP